MGSKIKCNELTINRMILNHGNVKGLETIFQNNVKKLVLDSASNYIIFENYKGLGSLKTIEINGESSEIQVHRIKIWTEKANWLFTKDSDRFLKCDYNNQVLF